MTSRILASIAKLSVGLHPAVGLQGTVPRVAVGAVWCPPKYPTGIVARDVLGAEMPAAGVASCRKSRKRKQPSAVRTVAAIVGRCRVPAAAIVGRCRVPAAACARLLTTMACILVLLYFLHLFLNKIYSLFLNVNVNVKMTE